MRVSPWRTLQAASPLVFWRDLQRLDCHGYDLVVSDFEPLTAHAARRYGKPGFPLSAQHVPTPVFPRGHPPAAIAKCSDAGARCASPLGAVGHSAGRTWFVADLPTADLGRGMTLGVGLRATAEQP